MDSTANLCLKALVSKLGGSVVLPLKDIQREDVLTISTLAAQQPPSVMVSVERVGEPPMLLNIPESILAKCMEILIISDSLSPVQDPTEAKFLREFRAFIDNADVKKFGLALPIYLEKRA